MTHPAKPEAGCLDPSLLRSYLQLWFSFFPFFSLSPLLGIITRAIHIWQVEPVSERVYTLSPDTNKWMLVFTNVMMDGVPVMTWPFFALIEYSPGPASLDFSYLMRTLEHKLKMSAKLTFSLGLLQEQSRAWVRQGGSWMQVWNLPSPEAHQNQRLPWDGWLKVHICT